MTKLVAATKWIAALAVMVTFLVGIPVLLLAAPSPIDSERGIASIFQAIVDDGQIFDEAIISVLVGLAWLLWAYLLVAALAEVVGAVRGGVASVRGLSLGQSFARPVIAALMWSSTATTLAASTLGAGTVALATAPSAAAQPVTVDDSTSANNTTSVDRHGFGDPIPGEDIVEVGDGTLMIRGIQARSHLVETDDTMWDLAETHLGDGFRWREIANLNPDVDDPDLIVAGSLMYLPAEAINVNPPASTDVLPEPSSVTVADGDTLWDIADGHLVQSTGDQPGQDEIAALVADVDVADLASGDPNLIYPGETIELPAEPEVVVWTPDNDVDGGDADAEVAAIETESNTDLTAAIDAAEADWPMDAEVAAVEAEVAEAIPVEPAVEEGSPIDRPPAGLFFGQFPTDAAPPEPAADADITLGEVPPIPNAADVADTEFETDTSNGWDPQVAAVVADEEAATEPAATPNITVPGGVRVQPEVNSTVNPEDLAEPAGSRTVKSVNWTVLLAALPLLGGGIWAALRRRRRLTASRRPSRYAATETTEVEEDVTDALAGSSALERAAKLEALSAQIARWVPLDAPSLVAVTIDDETVAVLWDADLAPEPVGDPASVRVEGSSWLIAVDDLVSAIEAYPTHGLPALVHVGRLLSGRDLFVNLEELGRVNLEGEPRAIEQFSGRLAMELALSPLFGLGTLVLIDFGSQLAAIDNIEYYASSDEALRALAPRLPSLERAMTTNSALQLRAAGQLDSEISPIVVIDLSDSAPNAGLIAAADACVGGLCMLHAGDVETSWPVTIDHEHIHVGGALDVSVINNEPDEETIGKILAMVAADIEYEPADTIEGAVSDSFISEEPDAEEVEDEYRAGIHVLVQPEPDSLDNIDEWLVDPSDVPKAFADGRIVEVDDLVFLPDPEPLSSPTGVRLRMLGTVSIEGAEFSKKAARYLELVALMVARGGKITVNEISTHMFDGEGSVAAVHALLTRTRKALGETTEGEPRLSFETPTKQYELVDVCSDYQQIIEVCNQIKNDDTLSREEACQLMDSAAQLIEGPPYAAAGESFDWVFTAGEASQAILAADSLCRELGEVYLALGNYPRARWSIRQGLKACPACDELYEALIVVVAQDGTSSDLKALWAEIEASYEAADLEVPLSLAEVYGLALRGGVPSPV